MPSARLVLDDGPDRYTLVVARATEPVEVPDADVLPPARALERLARVLEPEDHLALRRLLDAHEGLGAHDDDAALLDRIAALLHAGQLVLVHEQPAHAPLDDEPEPVDLVDLVDDIPPLVPDAPEPEPILEPTFVAFRLLDDDGTPIPQQRFSITLPDGRTMQGITDDRGRFEVDPVQVPGTCSIRFEELSEALSEARTG